MRSQVWEQNSSPHQVRGRSLLLIPRQMHILLQRQSGRLSLPLAQDDDTVYCPANVEEKVNPSSKWRKLTRTKFNASPKPRQSSFPPQSRGNCWSPNARPRNFFCKARFHYSFPSLVKAENSFYRRAQVMNSSCCPANVADKLILSQSGNNFGPARVNYKTQSLFKAEETVCHQTQEQGKAFCQTKMEDKFYKLLEAGDTVCGPAQDSETVYCKANSRTNFMPSSNQRLTFIA